MFWEFLQNMITKEWISRLLYLNGTSQSLVPDIIYIMEHHSYYEIKWKSSQNLQKKNPA